MFNKLVSAISYKLNLSSLQYQVDWCTKDTSSWLYKFINTPYNKKQPISTSQQIESNIAKTAKFGKKPLWFYYKKLNNYKKEEDMVRSSKQVSIDKSMGAFFEKLVISKKPKIIVEFGTAFGISGMYWLSGLDKNKKGKLLTFEPNKIWAKIADKNLKSISNKYILTIGTFERNVSKVIKNDKIDIAFIDAIHTSKFVDKQFKLIVEISKPGSIILIDDIDFSDDMKQCWNKLSFSSIIKSSVALNRKVGVLEIK